LLPDALWRVVASGVAVSEAKIEICQAVADGKIRIRVMVSEREPNVGGRLLEIGDVEIPPRLVPNDFDWANSRPSRPWMTGPDNRNPAERYLVNWPWKPRSLQWVQLRTTDIVEVLCEGVAQPTPGTAQEKAQRSSSRKRHQFVADYIAGKNAAGKRPTQGELEKTAVAAGIRGAREELRTIFKKLMGPEVVERGRPRKSPPESAKK
jgi:hypothetical protein